MDKRLKTTELDLKEYADKSPYTSNVVDIIIVALAKKTSVKPTIYSIDDENVSKQLIQPIDGFQANIEFSFVDGHRDFISSSTIV